MRKLLAALLLVLVASPAQAATYKDYDFVTTADSVAGLDSVIVKGGASPAEITAMKNAVPAWVVNYEQAFALNDTEAAYARSRGWLAETCAGAEIHPANIPSVTLMDATIPAARDWRVGMVADETLASGYEASYWDTLGAYYPDSFYTARPCGVTDTQWLNASIAEVDGLQTASGLPVIENGFGLGSGKKFFASQPDSGQLVAAGNAVQIEHFKGTTDDKRFITYLLDRSKRVYAKCDATTTVCVNAFSAVTTSTDLAYLKP